MAARCAEVVVGPGHVDLSSVLVHVSHWKAVGSEARAREGRGNVGLERYEEGLGKTYSSVVGSGSQDRTLLVDGAIPENVEGAIRSSAYG